MRKEIPHLQRAVRSAGERGFREGSGKAGLSWASMLKPKPGPISCWPLEEPAKGICPGPFSNDIISKMSFGFEFHPKFLFFIKF